MKWPEDDDEWTEALRAAVFCLGIESARLYGLITGERVVDVARCDVLIAAGHRLGYYVPTLAEVMA